MKGAKVTVLILSLLVLVAVNLREKDEGKGGREDISSGTNTRQLTDTPERSVHLHLLNRLTEGSPGVEKNLFGSIFDRPSPPPPKPSPPVQVKVPPPPQPSPLLPSAVLQRQPPVPPPSVEVLGFLNKKGDRRIFLSMGKKVFAVRETECFGDGEKFCLAEIAADHLIIQEKGRSLPLSIPLIEEDRKILARQKEEQQQQQQDPLLHAPTPAFIPLPGYSARASLELSEGSGPTRDIVQILPGRQGE